MVCIGAAANPQHRRAFPCHELRLKTTPRPRATKAKGGLTPSRPDLTEAEDRILKAVDVTRVLHKHKEAKDRDMGFAVLLVHLNAAYKALYRYSNPDAHDPAGKAQSAAFDAAHKRWLKVQAVWKAVSWGGKGMSQAAYDRLVAKTHGKRERATERLEAIRSQDVRQLSCKTDALWDVLTCDFKSEAEAIGYGDCNAEAFGLLKSIRRDGAQLAARGRP